MYLKLKMAKLSFLLMEMDIFYRTALVAINDVLKAEGSLS
jgi:hypothetical protein